MHKDNIRKLTPKEYKGFVFEKEVENGDRSFIKFVNVIDEQTLLFMVNQKGICTSVSRMYNTWLYDQIAKELKRDYEKIGSDLWKETKDGKEYEIKLKQGEWYITVITRPITKK
ncbi:MAG: hypothetical protein AB7S48_01350 [Bacteroidales bacterium]